MIDYERLTYPGGVAVATILKSPGAGIRKALFLVSAAVVSAAVHFTCQVTGVDNWDLGSVLGFPEYMNGIWYLSLLTVGAAFIAGKGGVAFIIGGFACYWVIAPLLAVCGLLPVDMTEWLSDDDVVYAITDTLPLLDLSDFYTEYRKDGIGGSFYDFFIYILSGLHFLQ